MARRDYLREITADLIYQFREQPNTTAIIEAVARQLQGVYDFYEQLRTLTALDTSVCRQLDGIGNIVVMSRAEAAFLAGLGAPDEMADELYRKYLKYKIFLNTSNGTYHDVLNGLKMFVPDIPLYYAEDPKHPATMFFDTPDLTDDEIEYVFAAPIARAAGVQVVIRAKTRTPLSRNIRVLTLEQYKWTLAKQTPWIRPGDERNLRVSALAQFKKTRTEPVSLLSLGLARRLTVSPLTQFKATLTVPPMLIPHRRNISVRAFQQFSVSLGNVPKYQE